MEGVVEEEMGLQSGSGCDVEYSDGGGRTQLTLFFMLLKHLPFS